MCQKAIKGFFVVFLIFYLFSFFPDRAAAGEFDKEEFNRAFPRWELITNGVVAGLNVYLATLPEPAPSFGPPASTSPDYEIGENHEYLNHEHFSKMSDWIMYPLVIGPPASYLAGHYLDEVAIESPELKFFAYLEAVNFNELITISAKKLVGRERPDRSDNESFISGHASSSFTGASFFAWDAANLIGRRVPSDAWVGYRVGARVLPFAVLYSAAGLVGYYRIAAEKHYFSDVVAGGVTGILCGNFFYLYHFHPNGTPRRGGSEKAQIYPVIEPDYRGLQVVWSY